MLNQTRISHFIEGNNEESLCPLHVKIQMFRYSVIVLGNSSSHFFEVTMLVRKVGTLTH